MSEITKVNKKPLTAKQEKFCKYYVFEADGNAGLAAELAGYSEAVSTRKTSTLLNNPVIQERIAKLQAEMRVEMKESGFDLYNFFRDIAESESERTSDRIKAGELIGKMTGQFVNKVEVNSSEKNPLEGLTTDELKALANADNVVPFEKVE